MLTSKKCLKIREHDDLWPRRWFNRTSPRQVDDGHAPVIERYQDVVVGPHSHEGHAAAVERVTTTAFPRELANNGGPRGLGHVGGWRPPRG